MENNNDNLTHYQLVAAQQKQKEIKDKKYHLEKLRTRGAGITVKCCYFLKYIEQSPFWVKM